MTKITIKIKDDQAKMWAYFLQQKYNTTQTDLSKLAEMAILYEVAKSAQDILDITEGNLVQTGFYTNDLKKPQEIQK